MFNNVRQYTKARLLKNCIKSVIKQKAAEKCSNLEKIYN